MKVIGCFHEVFGLSGVDLLVGEMWCLYLQKNNINKRIDNFFYIEERKWGFKYILNLYIFIFPLKLCNNFTNSNNLIMNFNFTKT